MPWLTPDEIPERTVCRPLFIPDDPAWLAIVSGAILPLTRFWEWEQFGTLTPEQCAEAMQVLQQRYYDEICNDCVLPSGGRVIRIDFDGHPEELVDGEWVAPQGDYALPPVPERDTGTPEEQTCLAAANAVNVLAQTYEEVSDMFADHFTEAAALLAMAVAIGTFIVPPVGLIAGGLLTFGLAAFGAFFRAMEFLTVDLWDADFTEAMRCVFYDCATNTAGVVTFDYACVTAKLENIAGQFDLTTEQVRLAFQVKYLLDIITIDGMNLAGSTTAITSADCWMCGDCDIVYNDTMDTALGPHTTLLPYDGSTPAASWQSTGGRTGGGAVWGYFRSGFGYYTYIQFDMGKDCHVQEFSVWWRKTNVNQFVGFRVTMTNEAGTLVYNELVHNGTIAENTWRQYARIIGLATGRYVRVTFQTSVAGGQIYLDDATVVTN